MQRLWAARLSQPRSLQRPEALPTARPYCRKCLCPKGGRFRKQSQKARLSKRCLGLPEPRHNGCKTATFFYQLLPGIRAATPLPASRRILRDRSRGHQALSSVSFGTPAALRCPLSHCGRSTALPPPLHTVRTSGRHIERPVPYSFFPSSKSWISYAYSIHTGLIKIKYYFIIKFIT